MTATALVPSDAKTFAYPTANDSIKGFLGTADDIIGVLPRDPVAQIHAMTNEELFPLGERALKDIVDDIIVLNEIRNRFRVQAPLMGYVNWKDFVEKNSRYSIRTVQNRLAELNGKDTSKVNHDIGNMHTRRGEQHEPRQQEHEGEAPVESVFKNLISALYSLTTSGNDGVEHKMVALLDEAELYLNRNPTLSEGADSSRRTVVYLLNRIATEFQTRALLIANAGVV
jgi:hypothetical protein